MADDNHMESCFVNIYIDIKENCVKNLRKNGKAGTYLEKGERREASLAARSVCVHRWYYLTYLTDGLTIFCAGKTIVLM